MSSPLQLPPLQVTVLDRPTLEQLFADIAACASHVSVQPRVRGAAAVPSITLGEARDRLGSGELQAAQVRYRYEGKNWCDTLIAQPNGVRLVRICEDDIAASVQKEEGS